MRRADDLDAATDDGVEVKITLQRVALATLVLIALEFAVLLGTIAIAPFIFVHFLALVDIPSFSEIMKNSNQTADQIKTLSIFMSGVLVWCMLTPVLITLWGVKAFLNGSKIKSAIFSIFWCLYAYEAGAYPKLSSIEWLTNADIVIPIICVIALAIAYFRPEEEVDNV
jgi:hypothetical protein